MPMISDALTSARPHQNNINGHHPTAMAADHLAALVLPDATKCVISGNYNCRFCSKPFSSRSNMVVHERIHTRERPYSCSFCERAFSQHGQLVIHERSHTGHRPYKCQYCEKAFTSNKVLKIHVRTHTGEKPYACEHCGKRFAAYANLVVHRRIHTKVRPYKCPYCGRTFEHSGNLQRHIKIHTRNLVAGAVGIGQEEQRSGEMKTDVMLDKYEPDIRPQYTMLSSGEVPVHSSVTAGSKLRFSQITKQSDASRHQQTSWTGNAPAQECPRLCQILGSSRPRLLGLGEMHGYLNSHQQQQLQYGQYCNLPLTSIGANSSQSQHRQISASPEDLSIKGATRITMKMETELESEILCCPRSSLTPEPSDQSVDGNWKQCEARITPVGSPRSSPELNQGPDSTHKALKQGSVKALSPKAAWMQSYLTTASETLRVPLSYDIGENHAKPGQGVQPTDEPVEMQESYITSSVGTDYKNETTSIEHRETKSFSKPLVLSEEHASPKPILPLSLHQLHKTLAYVNPHHQISYSSFGLPHQTSCLPNEPYPALFRQNQPIPPFSDNALQLECQDLSVKTAKHLPALIPISKLSNSLLR